MSFEDLTEEVQSDIFYKSGAYSITKRYYEGMLEQRKLDCLRSISSREIGLALMNNENLPIIINEILHNGRIISTLYKRDRTYTVMISDNTIFISIYKMGISNIEFGKVYFKFSTDKIYRSYSSILLTPKSINILTNRRGTLCQTHAKEIRNRYIYTTCGELVIEDTHFCIEWLILCVLDINESALNDIFSNIIVTHSGSKESKYYIDVNKYEEYIPTLYNYVLENV